MIIDAHMHVGVWDHPDFLGRRCDVADVVRVLEASGMAGAAMAPTDRCDNAGLLADARAAIESGFCGSLWMFAWVKPTADAGGQDLAWVRDNIDSVLGLKIHPSLSRTRVTDAGFEPALRLAELHQLVVLVHCGRWQEMASYRFAIDAAEAHPGAKFLLAHAGGDTPPNATAAARLVADRGLDNVWFEFSGLREYWVVERNVALLGADRYLMGSDFGLGHPLMYIGAVRGMDLPDAAKQRILGLNAAELFGPPIGL